MWVSTATGSGSFSTPPSPLLSLFSTQSLSPSLALNNPVTADLNGNYFFCVAPQPLLIQVGGTGLTPFTQNNYFPPNDPLNPFGLVTLDLIEGTAPTVSVSGHDKCYGDSTAHLIECSFNGGAFSQLVTAGASQTLVNKTLTAPTITSPVINGTPSGTGIPTYTTKVGSGAGTYSSASTSYTAVDGTNLSFTVTIPLGWKLAMWGEGSVFTATAVTTWGIALVDTSTSTTLVATTGQSVGTGSSQATPFNLPAVITGDGNSHTVQMQYKTAAGGDVVSILNSGNATNGLPTMLFILTPSN